MREGSGFATGLSQHSAAVCSLCSLPHAGAAAGLWLCPVRGKLLNHVEMCYKYIIGCDVAEQADTPLIAIEMQRLSS